MVFDSSRFSALSTMPPYANSGADAIPAMYGYFTADAAATVDTTGYFNDLVNQLRVGDLIYCVAAGVPGFFYVSFNDGTDVDVNNMFSIATADTD